MVCNHHGNHIMMKVVGKCEESGTREFRFENTLGRETLYFFGESGRCDRRRRVSVSAVSRFHRGNWSTKCAQDCCQSSNLYKNRKNLMGLEHFWKMGSTKCARHCSESSISNWQCKKIVRVSDNFWKMRSANSARDHVAGVNKMRAGLFWARQFFTIFMWHRALATVSCTFYRPYLPKVFQTPQLFNTSKWKSSLCLKNCRDPSTFGRWGRQTVNETVVRSISPWTC